MEYIGVHVTKKYNSKQKLTMEQSIESTKKELNFPQMRVCQIFVAEPSGYHYLIKKDQEDSFSTFIKRSGMIVLAHGRYLDTPFSSNVTQSTLTYIRNEVSLCNRLGIKGFIIHLYRYPASLVIDILKKLDLDPNVQIILETPAISPDKAIYNSPLALYHLYHATKQAKLNCGICIDTCHIYSAGLNITDLKIMKDFFTEIIKLIPSKDIVIHLNDSAAVLGSGIDRHASLGEGKIWEKHTTSLTWLLQFIKKYKIITILERSNKNGSLKLDLSVIKELL